MLYGMWGFRKSLGCSCTVGAVVLAGFLLSCGIEVYGCAVPVFRYALIRWPSDPYRLTVFHQGPLETNDEALVALARDAADQGAVNLAVESVDVSAVADPAQNRVWLEHNSPELPWMSLEYPNAPGPTWLRANDESMRAPPVWTGALEPEAIRGLLDSPARRELARRLMGGHSVVWLVLESGEKTTDDNLYGVLSAELKKQEEVMAAQASSNGAAGQETDDAFTEKYGDAPVQYVFSALRVSRAQPAESLFVAQLLGMDRKLALGSGPLVFPVFGRARVLTGLPGSEVTPDSIAQVTSFLCGDCTCMIKDENPGTPLLVAAAWENGSDGGGLSAEFAEKPASLPAAGVTPPEPAPPQADPLRNLAAAFPRPDVPGRASSGGLSRNLIAVIVVSLVVVTVASAVIVTRGR